MSEQREILFRGKRIDNGAWIYGPYIPADASGYIYLRERHPKMEMVYQKTVGQYTGLKDRKGTRIFEGDIVNVHDALVKCTAPYHEFDGVVNFEDGSFCVVSNEYTGYRWMDYDVTVIGNIHDNPQLLENDQ